MRRTSLVVAGALLLSGLVMTSGQSAQAAAGDSGGTYVSVDSARLYDSSASGSTRATVDVGRNVKVLGTAGIPAEGVGAVVVDVSARSTTGPTKVYAKSEAKLAEASILSVGDDTQFHANTAVVAPGPNGTISINTSDQPVDFNVDVQGYFTSAATDDSAGGYVPLNPTRIYASDSGVGTTKAKLQAGTTYSVQAQGLADIPTDASAIFANVRVLNSTGSGEIKISSSASSPSSSMAANNYAAGQVSDTGRAIPLGTDGKFKVAITSGSADVIVDVQGYFTASTYGGEFNALSNQFAYDSRTGDGRLQPGEIREVQLLGAGDIPDDGDVDSVVTTVTAIDWGSSGSIAVWDADEDSANGTSNVAFVAPYKDANESSTSIVHLSDAGTVKIQNNSASPVHVVLGSQGYFGSALLGGTAATSSPYALSPVTAGSGKTSVSWTPSIDSTDYLDLDNGIVSVFDAGDEKIGQYAITAKDSKGTVVKTTPTVSGATITATLATASTTTNPITVRADYTSLETRVDYDDAVETDDSCPEGQMCAQAAVGKIRYRLVSHSKTKNVTDYKHRLGYCKALEGEVICTITPKPATRSIGTAFGVSKTFVAGQLNISSASSVSISARCSQRVKKGYMLAAYALGSKHRYKIRKENVASGKVVSSTDSGWRRTYNPYKSSLSCRVEKAK